MINNQFQTTLDTPCFSSTWSFFVTKHELGPIQERELDQCGLEIRIFNPYLPLATSGARFLATTTMP